MTVPVMTCVKMEEHVWYIIIVCHSMYEFSFSCAKAFMKKVAETTVSVTYES